MSFSNPIISARVIGRERDEKNIAMGSCCLALPLLLTLTIFFTVIHIAEFAEEKGKGAAWNFSAAMMLSLVNILCYSTVMQTVDTREDKKKGLLASASEALR